MTPRDYAAEALDRGRELEDDRDREAEAREAAGCERCSFCRGGLAVDDDGRERDCPRCDGTAYVLPECRVCGHTLRGEDCAPCAAARAQAEREEVFDECPW